MHILNFLFFFGMNNTKYPINNYNSWIYPFLKFSLTNSFKVSRGEVQSTSTLNNWARYVDKINKQDWG